MSNVRAIGADRSPHQAEPVAGLVTTLQSRSPILPRAAQHPRKPAECPDLDDVLVGVGRRYRREDRSVDAMDLTVRKATYRLFVELGRAPLAAEVVDAADLTDAQISSVWLRLHDEHALVLDRGSDQLLMAHPFSAVPTPHRVEAGGRWWYANCPWDAFGICAALDVDGHIESVCPDCGDHLTIDVQARRPSDTSLLFHSLVPASRWWDDIVFT